MGEVDMSSCGNLKLVEGSEAELTLPMGREEGEKFGNPSLSDCDGCPILKGRDCGGCEALSVSERVCTFVEGNKGSADQTLNGFQSVGLACHESGSLEISNSETEERAEISYSPSCDHNGVSVNYGNGSGVSVSGRNELEDGCGRSAGIKEESGHLVVEPAAAVDTLNTVTEDKKHDLSAVLPLGTVGGDDLGGSSGVITRVEGGYSPGLFKQDRDCNGCEEAIRVSLGSVTDLLSSDGDTAKQADGFCCPPRECLDASSNPEENWMGGRSGNLFLLKAERIVSSPCSSQMLCSDDERRDENLCSLGIAKGLSLDCVGAKEGQKEGDACVPSEETGISLQEVSEERHQTSHLDIEASSSVQGSPSKVTCCSAVEGPISLQSSHLLSAVQDCPSKLSLVPEHQESDADAVNSTPNCYSNIGDSCRPADIAGKGNSKSNPIIVFRRTNPKRAASSRSSRTDGKSDQLTRTSSARKCRQAVDPSTSFSSSTVTISSKEVTKRRRCSRKPAHLSVWGKVENLLNIFEKNVGVPRYDNDAIEILNKRAKKERCDAGKRKRQMARKVGDSRLPKTKCAALNNAIPIKNPRCLQPLFPVFVDSQACIQTGISDRLRKSDCEFDLGISRKGDQVKQKLAAERAIQQLSYLNGNLENPVKSLQWDGQHGDRDLESTVTQDTSVENTLGDCPGVSSRVGPEAHVETVDDRFLLDPGTSPDSVVLHPLIDVGISSEGATSVYREASTAQHGVHADALTCCETFVAPESVSPSDTLQHTNPEEGKKISKDKGSPCLLSKDHPLEEKLHGSRKLSKARKMSRRGGPEKNRRAVPDRKLSLCSKSIRKNSRKGSNCKGFTIGLPVLGMAELECCQESLKVETGLETWALSGQNVGNAPMEARMPVASSPTAKTNGRKLPRSFIVGVTESRSSHSDSARRRRQNAHGQKKGNLQKSYNKRKTKEESQAVDACLETSGGAIFSSGKANKLSLDEPAEFSSKINAVSEFASDETSVCVLTPVDDELATNKSNHGLEGHCIRQRVAWVLCDDCQKWRCISAALADTIDETNCKWTCKDNFDKAFADCSIPQEKTNAEINAELEISDASCGEDFSNAQPNIARLEPSKLAANQQASWALIKSNCFLHRSRKTQTIDEIMVCHCKPPLDGSLGCGDECLNRMLNIECVRGTCPCGDLCSNQLFQKRKYANLKWFRCGKKGYGLQLLEDVSGGEFLIEYVGEVLDLTAYEARQRNYASRGQKHFYFMTLNGSEVIDACAKGNLGRFINHSCDPNCRTEKWMVKGEVCIGLFAIRDIKKGEEVTFDYNYVRVFGAAAKKCVCGSSECRGYIGGDPSKTEVIVQGDSDEEYPEPVMVHENGKGLDVDNTIPNAIDVKVMKHDEKSMRTTDTISICSPAIPESEIHLETKDTICRPLADVHPLDNPAQISNPIQTGETICKPLPDIQFTETSSQALSTVQTEETMFRPLSDVQSLEVSSQSLIATSKSISNSFVNHKSMSNPVEHKPNTLKLYPSAKSSRSTGTVKKGRSNAKSLAFHKAKKVVTAGARECFEGVEEKLNELLDADGGISKRKDAISYLKLLFVTAAEDSASQSTRDLSLVLDAILKTKSLIVLEDIINKNGLQMLHNIMKQNQNKFNRIPIIRKLLKVLEFLAQKGILTPEHINKGPPCIGMESFKQSILSLTKDKDHQVHQIAWNFVDKWIPRTSRRAELTDRDNGSLDPQRAYRKWSQSSVLESRHDQGSRDTDAVVCVSEAVIPAEISSLPFQQGSNSVPVADSNPTSGTRTRKRKSRWDQPSDITSPDSQPSRSIEDQTVKPGSKFMKCVPAQTELNLQLEVSKQKSNTQRRENSSSEEAAGVTNSIKEIDDEAPPGFESSHKDNHSEVPSKNLVATGEVVVGHLQERYLSHMTVSYGIPLALIEKLGATGTGDRQCHPSWAIAPSMPFHPFPPLPPYPRENFHSMTLEHTPSNHKNMVRGGREEAQQARKCPAATRTDPSIPSASGEKPAEVVETGARNSRSAERVRWSSNGGEKRWSSRPHTGDNHKFHRCGPPWPQERDDYGSRGSTRNGMHSLGVETVRRDVSGGSYSSEGVGRDDVCSNFHQQNHN